MAETMLVGVDVGRTFTDLVLVVLTVADPRSVDRHATDELRRRGRR
jgi:hypothetical protein